MLRPLRQKPTPLHLRPGGPKMALRRWQALSLLGLLLLLFGSLAAQAQTTTIRKRSPDPDATAQDTLRLSLQEFYRLVLAYHPVGQQARLLSERAQADLLSARGLFDPVLQADWNVKELKDELYYNTLDGFVKVPLWFGPDFKVGFERNIGANTNPETNTTTAGLGYLGFSLPVLRGLLMDQRRNDLRQAQVMRRMAEVQRLKVLNKLLFSAAKTYWDWYGAWLNYQYLATGVDLADFRFRAVVQRYQLGDLAQIDSVEAALEVQKRQADAVKARQKWQAATLRLSNFLWAPQEIPVELEAPAIPQTAPPEPQGIARAVLEDDLRFASETHPEIRKLQLKLEQLAFERRFRKQQLLPQLDLEYKPLLMPGKQNLETGHFTENYKFGARFYFPILLRKERGKLRSVQLKIVDNTYQLDQQRLEVRNALREARFAVENFSELVQVAQRQLQSAQRLRDGEEIKFENGESSLFLINRRERSLIDAQVKLAEARAKYAKSLAQYSFATGRPLQELLLPELE